MISQYRAVIHFFHLNAYTFGSYYSLHENWKIVCCGINNNQYEQHLSEEHNASNIDSICSNSQALTG